MATATSQAERTYTLTLSEDEATVLRRVLGERSDEGTFEIYDALDDELADNGIIEE